MLDPVWQPIPNDSESFRLLSLHAGGANSQIEATLIVARLSQPPHYEALSYNWELAQVPHEQFQQNIKVNGEQLISLRPNLAAALKTLRYLDAQRLLYVDALCIDQEDKHEKARQVMLMGKIFKTAARVLSWLGPSDVATDTLFEATTKVGPGDYIGYEVDTAVWRNSHVCPQSELTSLKQTMMSLIDRTYWRRAWIVQECILAKDVVLCCGHASASWDKFRLLYMMLLQKDPNIKGYTAGYLDDRITRFDHLAAERANRDKYPMPLATIVNYFQSWESTDARDMVFAFLDLITESQVDHPRRIQADYSPSVSVTEVYFRACHAYLLDPKARPHRVLGPLRHMLRLRSEEIFSEIIKLIDPSDLWCEIEWITGKLPEVDAKLNERKPGAAYMTCHEVDFARLVKRLDELKPIAPSHSDNP